MDMGLGFLGTYITAAELVGKEPTLTIGKITLEKVESLKVSDDGGAGKVKDRVIVYFRESKGERGWLLNRTNAECLKELWGRETDNWIGHQITLYTTQVRVGPKMEPGIRIKGSPELDKPRTFDLRLPRKKPTPMTLIKTGNGAGKRPGAPQQPATDEATIADKLRACTDRQTLAVLGDDLREISVDAATRERLFTVWAECDAKLAAA